MYMGWGGTGKKNNILKVLHSHQDERGNIYAQNIKNLLKKINNSDLDSLMGWSSCLSQEYTPVI
jgi:hypothetical protein